MKVQFKQTRVIDEKTYQPGIHEVPADEEQAFRDHWFVQALIEEGSVVILGDAVVSEEEQSDIDRQRAAVASAQAARDAQANKAAADAETVYAAGKVYEIDGEKQFAVEEDGKVVLVKEDGLTDDERLGFVESGDLEDPTA